ncbi:GNAT family N-acetyltransferase [Jannaschia sp. Os4]|uniref:GNAT family N-acetyltransferase n=1 Tax=Jannaschia sp. Os4 TaxID=2807617 RepID=UPI0019398144|nr:GNAT family N-acetyltransferase [Jannaschia sp. Os4]MBM2577935.1 GNAT family N-acetyltransferase [Jannaschia sp. Os4]
MELPITDRRVTLRRLAPGDLDSFLAYRTDPAVVGLQSHGDMTPAGAEAMLADDGALLAPGRWTQIAVEVEGRLVGDMGLHPAHGAVEMGITLAAEAHGSGIARAAVALAAGWVWAATDAARIVAITDRHNGAALAVLDRMGWREAEVEAAFAVDPATERSFVLDRPRV